MVVSFEREADARGYLIVLRKNLLVRPYIHLQGTGQVTRDRCACCRIGCIQATCAFPYPFCSSSRDPADTLFQH